MKRKRCPFPTLYVSKDELGSDALPVSLYLYSLGKDGGQYKK
ncbi:hypothetical protein [Thermococcus sp.]|nr:hypothetical protein [Thermococcus sp.]